MSFDTRNGAVFGFLAQHTSNPERRAEFYRQVFDWTELGEDRQFGIFMKRAKSDNPEAVVLDASDIEGVPVGQWVPHIAVDDIHAVASRCVAMGGTIVSDIRPVWEDDPGLTCRICDPEGGILALLQVARE